MKKLLIIAVAALMATFCAYAQGGSVKPYFSAEELPNGILWLPSPPDSTSTQFVYDITQYVWGKSIRDTERGQQAIAHGAIQVADMAALFSEPFGLFISEKTTPAIFRLLNRAIPTFRLSVTEPKSVYMRKRPYVLFNEPTLIPADEEVLRDTGSYPSGHTIRGWGVALVLCEVNPSHQDAILKLGYEWGQSRVIAGYHWQSDVDASRMMAAAVFARLHTNADFLADMAAACAEYRRLMGN